MACHECYESHYMIGHVCVHVFVLCAHMHIFMAASYVHAFHGCGTCTYVVYVLIYAHAWVHGFKSCSHQWLLQSVHTDDARVVIESQ